MKRIYAVLITVAILFGIGAISSGAFYVSLVDVGNFNDYGGGDYGGFDYDFDNNYNYDYEDKNKDNYYDNDSSSDSPPEPWAVAVGFVIITIFIVVSIYNRIFGKRNRTVEHIPPEHIQHTDEPRDFTEEISAEIQKGDPEFSAEKFISMSKNLFITLQNAWTERDWEKIRTFEKEELFEQHNTQLQEYIRMGRINIIERINVNRAFMHLYRREREYEYITVYMEVRMKDYIIDENTKKVLQGDPNREYHLKYMLTFMRRVGVKTHIIDGVQSSFCPHCGAPVDTASAGKCQYCGSIVKSGEFNWVLSDIEAVKGNYKIDNRGIIIE